jgi:HAD superfamily hydrolase (TIGR01549 family)
MSKNKKQIQAVIFDLGDTIINFGKVSALNIFAKSCWLTYDFLRQNNQPAGSYPLYYLKNIGNIYWQLLKSKISGKDFDARRELEKGCVKKGINLTAQQLEEFVWLWYQPLYEKSSTEQDLKTTLAELKKQDLKLGILSNTFIPRTCLDRHLRELGVLDYFDFQLYSCEFTCRKPSPEIFIEAADKMGVRLPDIAFVGDRINKDIKPALFLDMTAVLKKAYTNHNNEIPEKAYQIQKLNELPELIKNINTENGKD